MGFSLVASPAQPYRRVRLIHVAEFAPPNRRRFRGASQIEKFAGRRVLSGDAGRVKVLKTD
ncbi:MAG TPA: hypothetical protein VGE52_06685 [Pirellulales bacterium]